MQIGEHPTDKMLVPTYPVIQYGHDSAGGDSIGSGFVYNGQAVPLLRGKYIFTDLTTGRIWCANYTDMLAADDGKPGTLAPIHEVKIRWKSKAHDLDVSRGRSRVPRARRQEPAAPGEFEPGLRRPLRRALLDRRRRRAVSLQQGRRHDS